MKASDFITHLQQMIEEHGDLPLALLEIDYDTGRFSFGAANIDSVYSLEKGEYLFDIEYNVANERKVFLID